MSSAGYDHPFQESASAHSATDIPPFEAFPIAPSQPPVVSLSDASPAAECSPRLGLAWLMAPSSWKICQEGQLRTFCPLTSESGDHGLHPILDVEIRWVDDSAQGVCYFVRPFVQSTAAPRFSQPLGVDIARTVSHLALVQSILIPLISSDPQSRSKKELVVPPFSHSSDHYYMGGGRMVGEGGALQPACLLSFGSIPELFLQVVGGQHSFPSGEVHLYPSPVQDGYIVQSSCPFVGLDEVQFLTRRKLSDIFSVQSLLFILQHSAFY